MNGRALASLLVVAFATGPDLHERTCDPAGTCCEEWMLDLRKADGTVWGAITARSPGELQQKLARAQEFDRRYCDFLDKGPGCTELEHGNPSAPRCVDAPRPSAHLCDPGTAQRVRGLEQRIASDTQRLALQSAAMDALGHGMASLHPGTNPFANLGHTTMSWGLALRDATTRLTQVKETLLTCVQESGRVTSAEDLFATGTSPDERQRQASADLDRLEPTLPQVPDFTIPEIEVPPGGDVKLEPTRNEPRGEIILGRNGPARTGMKLASGRVPVAFAYFGEDGFWRATAAMITERKPTPDGHGEILTLCGKGGGLHEMWTLTLGPADRDRDGFFDYKDKCPDIVGTIEGCPRDSDKDGIPDKDDACPQLVGQKALRGCPPDRDRDGFYDPIDGCPDVAGNVKGCPSDRDGDGVADDADRCPGEKGLATAGGCPPKRDRPTTAQTYSLEDCDAIVYELAGMRSAPSLSVARVEGWANETCWNQGKVCKAVKDGIVPAPSCFDPRASFIEPIQNRYFMFGVRYSTESGDHFSFVCCDPGARGTPSVNQHTPGNILDAACDPGPCPEND